MFAQATTGGDSLPEAVLFFSLGFSRCMGVMRVDVKGIENNDMTMRECFIFS